MRVVAGTARGRQLRSPRGRAIRPTSDRAREGIFNSLVSLTDLDGVTVLDIFAGHRISVSICSRYGFPDAPSTAAPRRLYP